MRIPIVTAAAVALGLAACANSPGVGWGPVELVLDARWQVPDDRKTSSDAIALAGGWLVDVDEVVLTVATARLQSTVSGGTAADPTFDPANPPAGYSNCHSGHCHADDGRLVAFEDIAADIAGRDGAGPVDLLRFNRTRIDALTGDRMPPAICSETCLLGADVPSRLALDLAGLQIRGRVRDGRSVPRISGDKAFVASIPLAGLRLDALLAWPGLPDTEAPTWRVHADLVLGPVLLDAVDWATATGDPLTPDEEDLEDLAAAAAEITVDVAIRRD